MSMMRITFQSCYKHAFVLCANGIELYHINQFRKVQEEGALELERITTTSITSV